MTFTAANIFSFVGKPMRIKDGRVVTATLTASGGGWNLADTQHPDLLLEDVEVFTLCRVLNDWRAIPVTTPYRGEDMIGDAGFGTKEHAEETFRRNCELRAMDNVYPKDMTEDELRWYTWALTQPHQSVAARAARALAGYIKRTNPPAERGEEVE